jgi:hypothetical protein
VRTNAPRQVAAFKEALGEAEGEEETERLSILLDEARGLAAAAAGVGAAAARAKLDEAKVLLESALEIEDLSKKKRRTLKDAEKAATDGEWVLRGMPFFGEKDELLRLLQEVSVRLERPPSAETLCAYSKRRAP